LWPRGAGHPRHSKRSGEPYQAIIDSLLAFAAAWRFALFDRLVAGAQRLEGLPVDALLVAALVLLPALTAYAWRRWRETRRALDDRLRAEAALGASEARLRLLTRQLPAFLWTTDADLRLTTFAGGGFRRGGIDPRGRVGLTVAEFFGVADPAFAPLAAHRRALDGDPAEYPLHRDGRVYEVRVEPLRDAAGATVGTLGLGVDVTERVQATAALRDSEARFRAIFDRAAIGIALADRGRRLLACNPAYERFTGYGEGELRGRPFPTVTHPDDAAADLALYRELIVGAREYYQIEKRYVRSDGQLSWGRLTVSLVPADDGTPQYCVGMVEDITARKTAERERREAEYRLGASREHSARQELEIRWHHSGLSPRERRVVELVACGHTNAEIGRLLYIQPVTVKTHIHNASQKLGLTSGGREAVLDAARQRGLLAPEEASVHQPATPHTTECLGTDAAGIDPSGGGK